MKDVQYFRKLLTDTNKRLADLCQTWEAKLEKVPKSLGSYEDVSGNIRSTIGRSRLLTDRKGRLPQFKGLIDNCEFGYGEKETTCMDLQVRSFSFCMRA